MPDYSKGYYRIPNIIGRCRAAEVGVIPYAVYTILLMHADGKDRAWPAETTIAKELGISTRSVIRATMTLCKAGLLTIERDRGKKTVFQLSHNVEGNDSQSLVTESHWGNDSQSLDQCHTVTTVVTESHTINTPEQEPITKPLNKTPAPPAKPPAPPKAKKPARQMTMDDWQWTPESFDKFYAVYPKQVGETDARKVWARFMTHPELRPISLEYLLTTVGEYALSLNDPKFAIEPGKYLSGQRWKDKLEHVRGNGGNGGHGAQQGAERNPQPSMRSAPSGIPDIVKAHEQAIAEMKGQK